MEPILRMFTSTMVVALISIAASAQTTDQIAAESKRANEFFDKCWDENQSRHPLDESFYGIKTHYDQLEDLSDEKAAADHAVWQRQLATLKRDFKPELLDSHTQIPTFLINNHKIDNPKDADAYIARLNAIPKLFDQVIVNLRVREDKGVIAPRFVFPLVLDACRKVIQGKPFDSSTGDSPLLSDYKKKIGALKQVDPATRNRLIESATKALNESVKPAYQKLIAFLENQSRRANDDSGVWKF